MTSNSQTTVRRTALNPNAKEFVPTSVRPISSAVVPNAEEAASEHSKVSVDNITPSETSTADEESRRYWDSQLPDDILTPDLDFLGPLFEEKQEELILSGDLENSTDLVANGGTGQQHLIQTRSADGDSSAVSRYAEHVLEIPVGQLWDRDHNLSRNQLSLSSNWNGPILHKGNSFGYLTEVVDKSLASGGRNDVGPANAFSSEFPALATQSLADVYQAHNDDLHLRADMLSQLKLHDNRSSMQNARYQPLSSPSWKVTADFSTLSSPELASGFSQFLDDAEMQEATEMTSLVKRGNIQRRNNTSDFNLGPPRLLPQTLSSYGTSIPLPNDDRADYVPTQRNHRSPPQSWLENNEAVAHFHPDLREVRNHARARNPYFEQARQGYFSGSRARARDGGAKGQVHNRLMKAAYKSGEYFSQQRNIPTSQYPTFAPGQPRLLDLHGLHVNEAIALLKQELPAIRLAARSSRQRQQVFICVGSGYRGSRMRLPLAIERYLAEDEHLNFTEPQPGVIKVVLA